MSRNLRHNKLTSLPQNIGNLNLLEHIDLIIIMKDLIDYNILKFYSNEDK